MFAQKKKTRVRGIIKKENEWKKLRDILDDGECSSYMNVSSKRKRRGRDSAKFKPLKLMVTSESFTEIKTKGKENATNALFDF